MVGMYGIGGVTDAANVGQAASLGKRVSPETASLAKDEVKISPEAFTVARAAELTEVSEARKELQAARVTKAQEDIEKGTHRLQEVVKLVAGRVNIHLEAML
jgi:hypothetical protein